MARIKDVTLAKGNVIDPSGIARLCVSDDTKNAGELRHALGKRIRGAARGPVAYRDVSKDRGKSHSYDRDTANAIVLALNLPIRFVASRKSKPKPKDVTPDVTPDVTA